jgi:hypothetical protein
MFAQDLRHSTPTLPQVLFPVFGEEDGETALLGEWTGDVVGFCKGVDLPVVDIVRVPCYQYAASNSTGTEVDTKCVRTASRSERYESKRDSSRLSFLCRLFLFTTTLPLSSASSSALRLP